MCKKLFSVFAFVLVLVMAGNTLAATYIWDDGGEGNLWNVPENWDPDGLPAADDLAQINLPDANCVIDSSVNAQCSTVYVESTSVLNMTGGTIVCAGHFRVGTGSDSNSVMVMDGGTATSTNGRLWVGMSGVGTFIMNGGEMNIYDKIEVGKEAVGNGTIIMNGGTMNFTGNSTDLELGTRGTGVIYMYGGEMNVQDNVKLAQDATATGVGIIYLYGGTITAGNLRDPSGIYGQALIDITEGTLILPGDYSGIVNTYVENGWITAYDGLGELNIVYDEIMDQTILTATPLNLEYAQKPAPKSGAVDVPRDVVLSWRPGDLAEAHNVYFGADVNDVNEATMDDQRGVLLSQDLTDASFDPPGLLDYGQTYYWRVDEINNENPDSPWKGDVWSFTVLNYPIVIDDFEDYNDYPPNEIWNTWIDGFGDPTNGSTAGYPDPDFNTGEHYVEAEIVHSGLQSMPVFYDNSAGLSEVTRSFTSPLNNWTRDGVVTLTLFYYGDAENAAEPMYIALNGSAVVMNDDLNAALVTDWTRWDIPLQEFADRGANLANVGSMSIGFGNKANPVAGGGSGHVFFDDIRLYLP